MRKQWRGGGPQLESLGERIANQAPRIKQILV